MKKVIFLILMFVSVTSFAQNKFIEVEVTDTIALKPLKFQCNLYIDTYSYDAVVVEDVNATTYSEDNYDPLVAEEKAKNKLQEFKRTLETNRFNAGPLDESRVNFMERRGSSSTGFTVVVTGMDEMFRLKDLMNSRPDVTASVSVLQYADELKAEEKLIQKLISKAKARATVIGSTSGLKAGRILEVREGKQSNETNLTELYAQIAKMGSYGQESGDFSGSLTKTFVVKFAAE